MSMAAAPLVSGDLAAMQLQVADINAMIRDSADFELAYEMQLSEALRASTCGSSSSSSATCIGDGVDGAKHSDVEDSGALKDRDFAVAEQVLELGRLNQEMEDDLIAAREQSRLHEIEAIIQHDARFARRMSAAPANEYRSYSDPFQYTAKEEVTTLPRNQKETAMRSPLLARMSTSPLIMCPDEIWETALAAAFFADAPRPEGKSYLATINEGYRAGLEDAKLFPRCSICTEERMGPRNSLIVSNGCKHRFCVKCLQQYAEVAVKNGKSRLTCPEFDCKEVCSNEILERLLSIRTYVMLTQRQVEDAIPESERVYCPFRGCSALQLKPTLPQQASSSRHPHKTAVGGVECYACHRQFCLECKVPWHEDLTCAEFQAIPSHEREPEDLCLKALARSKNWQRCARCRFVVELTAGCQHISCRCGYQFCYSCGGTWTDGHVCRK